MTTYNRFTFQVLGMVDGTNAEEVSTAIRNALTAIPKTTVKTLNLDLWTDGFTGQIREFNEEGIDVATIEPPAAVTIPEVAMEPEIDVTVKA